MPAATNKSDLLAVFDKDLTKLRKTLDAINDEQSSLPLPDDETTIKGILAHRTHWMGKWTLGRYAEASGHLISGLPILISGKYCATRHDSAVRIN